MSQRTPRKSIPGIIVLSIIGAAISIWQTRLFFNTRSGASGFNSFCNIGNTFDCTAIEMSPYAELFSGMPLSALAIAAYLLIGVIALFGLSEQSKSNLRPLLVFFAALATAFSAFYLVIMTSVIGKLCLLCLVIDLTNVGLLILALRLPKEKTGVLEPSPGQVTATGVVVLLIAFLFTKALNPLAEMKASDVQDVVESVLNSPTHSVNISPTAPVIGNAQAPVTIIKFSDYQCPACRMAANALHPLMKRYPEKVKFIFMNYPLDSNCNSSLPRQMHPFACEAASVAVCAHQQGQFMTAYETLFENQEDFQTGKIADLLKDHGNIDLPKLKACLQAPSTLIQITDDIAAARAIKIQSTPTFFINGKKVEGGLPTAIWVKIIDQMLEQSSKSVDQNES